MNEECAKRAHNHHLYVYRRRQVYVFDLIGRRTNACMCELFFSFLLMSFPILNAITSSDKQHDMRVKNKM